MTRLGKNIYGFRLFSILTLLTAAIVPGTRAEDSAEESAETNAGGSTPVIQDEVFVEGTVPAIPTSNTVAAKLPLSLRETPASVAVIDPELLAAQDAFSVGDALENVSGLNVQPGSGTFDFFVVRGVDSLTSGLLLTDGAPEPQTTAYPLYNVERVEVMKGPASFLYGGGPMASTVNLVRKQPTSEDFVTFGASAGSFATYDATIDANVSNGDGTLSFRFNAFYQESENYRDDKESENLAVNPALVWHPSDRTSLTVNLEHVELDYVSDSGLPLVFTPSFTQEIPDVPRRRSYQSPFDVSDQEADRLQLDVETRLSDTRTIRNKTYYRRLDWFTIGTTFNGVFPDAQGVPVVSRLLSQLDDVQEFYGNQFEFLGRFTTGSITHNLLLGLELARRDDRFTFDVGILPDIELFNPVELATIPVFLPGFGFAADTTTDIVAPYVVDQITFSDKFQLLVGGRYDQIDFEDAAFAITRDDEQFSPMVGFVVLPTPTLSFYGNFGQGFVPQSTFVVAETRQPEESRQFELGVKKSAWNGRLNATLALYQLDRENIAIPDSMTGILQQTGDQRAEGLELEIRADPGAGVELRFSYAYTDSELTEFSEIVQLGPDLFVPVDYSGNRPAFTPEHLANLWISKQLPAGWTIGGGGRYLSEQFTEEDNVFELDDYFLLDAALFYRRGPWRFHVNLHNLTDEEYFTRASLGNSVIPRPGFAASSGFQYTF